MKIDPNFREFTACANAYDVRYLIVGGYAVALHGYPRYTKDLDVWVESTSKNAYRLLEALDAFGFGALDISIDDFLLPDQVVQLGYPPLRIDLMTTVTGVEFSSCYKDRVVLHDDDIDIPFIGLEHLRKNKRATGRHQDLADLEGLQ